MKGIAIFTQMALHTAPLQHSNHQQLYFNSDHETPRNGAFAKSYSQIIYT